MYKEKYRSQILCKNCGMKRVYQIPEGTLVIDFMRKNPCDNCRCLLNGNKKEGE